MEQLIPKIEVLLFMAKDSLSIEQLTKYTQSSEESVAEALVKIEKKYNESAEHGIQIISVSNGYQFATKPEYTKTLELYIHTPQEITISPAAMESLVIIAYRQPISKGEVETIRGVNSDGVMRSLLEKELIEELGKSDAIGHPTLYGTTTKFLKHFGLNSLADLPPEPKHKMNHNSEASQRLNSFHNAIYKQNELANASILGDESTSTEAETIKIEQNQ